MTYGTVQRKSTQSELGFTLMELVVAVFIVGVMAAVVTPHLLGVGKRAEQSACEQNQRTIHTALTEYYLIHHQYPQGTTEEQLNTLKSEQLLQAIPQDPSGGTYTITETENDVEVGCSVHGELDNP